MNIIPLDKHLKLPFLRIWLASKWQLFLHSWCMIVLQLVKSFMNVCPLIDQCLHIRRNKCLSNTMCVCISVYCLLVACMCKSMSVNVYTCICVYIYIYISFSRGFHYLFLLFVQLLLMKRGGRVIYAGPLGQNSQKMIEYFEVHKTFRERCMYFSPKHCIIKQS